MSLNDGYECIQIMSDNGQIINGECLFEMSKIPDGYIDFIATDLPYGTTQNKWDSIIPLNEMWCEFKRILKPNGVVALTSAQPFASKLVLSNTEWFKYDLVWEKTISSGQLNVKNQPMRAHESILIFYNDKPTYNEQKTVGSPYKIKRKIKFKEQSYGKQVDSEKINDGFRHAKSVIKISNPRVRDGHPTQKPIELMEYLIKTYSNENNIVLDCCMGSGTTIIAAINLKRKIIGIELDEKYFNMAKNRICEKIKI